MKFERLKKCVISATLVFLIFGCGSALLAEEAPAVAAPAVAAAAAAKIDTGDTAWVLTSTMLVLLMTIPALALFYGGLVRKKNVLSILAQCFFITCMVSVVWALIGYSLAFGTDIKGVIGGLDFALLNGIGADPLPNASTIPGTVWVVFQMTFAIITPALIIGAFAERMKFAAFAVFMLLWTLLVYSPVCHWVWGGGFISSWGALDFAGGTVVHINAGIAALVSALVLGKRKGYPKRISPPHNLPFAVIGASLLWVGWIGFNAGSALGANGLAGNALISTQLATAGAVLSWAMMDLIVNKHVTVLGMISGAVAGLVAVTPAAGFVTGIGGLLIGLGAGVICFISAVIMKAKLGYDDSLDAFGVHGVGGIWGALATGLFATTAINEAGQDGLFYGNPVLLWIQLKAVLVTIVFSFVMSYILLKLVDKFIGLRVSEHGERVGLDLTEHRESGYTLLD